MNPDEPLSTRAARMKIYNELVRQLDSEGGHYSQDLSEVDITDQEDVKVLANDPAGAVLVHLGSSDFLTRYKVYVSHVQSWRQQFDKLESVDLRYEHQIIVNPDQEGVAKAPALTPAAAKAAMAAGVKRAALIHVVTNTKPIGPQPLTPAAKPITTSVKQAPTTPTPNKVSAKPAPKPGKKVARHKHPPHKAVAKTKADAPKPQTHGLPDANNTKKATPVRAKSLTSAKKPSAAIA